MAGAVFGKKLGSILRYVQRSDGTEIRENSDRLAAGNGNLRDALGGVAPKFKKEP